MKLWKIAAVLIIATIIIYPQIAEEPAPKKQIIAVSEESIYNVPQSAVPTQVNTWTVPDVSAESSSHTEAKRELCLVCRGVGSCSVCDGLGTYHFMGKSSPCSACDATGDCWKCGGTGWK